MTKESQAIVDFCRVLARTRTLFRKSHIAAERSERFADVSCTVSHAEKKLKFGDQSVEIVESVETIEVSFSLDSELREETSDGRYSLGASVAIYNVDGVWKCIGDVGWSCRVGWDDFADMEAEFPSLEDFQNGLPRFVERVLSSYANLIEHHFQTVR